MESISCRGNIELRQVLLERLNYYVTFDDHIGKKSKQENTKLISEYNRAEKFPFFFFFHKKWAFFWNLWYFKISWFGNQRNHFKSVTKLSLGKSTSVNFFYANPIHAPKYQNFRTVSGSFENIKTPRKLSTKILKQEKILFRLAAKILVWIQSRDVSM